jgi:DNA repair ATPase RecN
MKLDKWEKKMKRLSSSDPDYKEKYNLLMKERQAMEDELTRLENSSKNTNNS